MANYLCEEPSVCTKFQSAICLHCNNRLCLLHLTEHAQTVSKTIEKLYNEVTTTSQQIDNTYEKTRSMHNNSLTSLNDWRARQTEKIQRTYENCVQNIESQQKALDIIQKELIQLLNRTARQPLELLQRQQNSNMMILAHIHESIKQVQAHTDKLKFNLITPPAEIFIGNSNDSSSLPVRTQISNGNMINSNVRVCYISFFSASPVKFVQELFVELLLLL